MFIPPSCRDPRPAAPYWFASINPARYRLYRKDFAMDCNSMYAFGHQSDVFLYEICVPHLFLYSYRSFFLNLSISLSLCFFFFLSFSRFLSPCGSWIVLTSLSYNWSLRGVVALRLGHWSCTAKSTFVFSLHWHFLFSIC